MVNSEESLALAAREGVYRRRWVCFSLFYFHGDARFRYVFISQLKLAHGVLFCVVVEFLKSVNSLPATLFIQFKVYDAFCVDFNGCRKLLMYYYY